MTPTDAEYYIIKNDEEDWSELGFDVGDKVYFKQIPGDLSIELKSYKTREEAMAAPPDPNLRAALGELQRWHPEEEKWIPMKEPTIEVMGWNAVGFKIHRI